MKKNVQVPPNRAIFLTSVLSALLKGFSVFYFLLLPILYVEGVLTAEGLGYIGALLVVGSVVGALGVTYKLHAYRKVPLLWLAVALLFGATFLLFWPHQILCLAGTSTLVGLALGVGAATTNALAAQFTLKGKRFRAFAGIAMLTDAIRITYPIVAGLIYGLAGFTGLVVFALITVIILSVFISLLTWLHPPDGPAEKKPAAAKPIRKNRSFLFVLTIEFLDSFASSQLFVFLPMLLIFKNFTIENALFMQSAVFAGYLSGRWFVKSLAERLSGFKAVGIAEVGMIVIIALLLALPASPFIYVLCFFLGLFSRGTSPVIKAMAFDQLEPEQMRRGSALHLIGGDSGSALGQLAFGLLLAWFGVTAPFLGAAMCAGLVAVACLAYREKVRTA